MAWVSDEFPGWIKVRLVDAAGRSWFFVDKVPVFNVDNLTAETAFPAPLEVRCEVVGEEDGGRVIVVSTGRDGVAAQHGSAEFRVRPGQLARL